MFSDHALEIESGRLYATPTREAIRQASDVFIELMWSMIYFMVGFSALIFVIVMYLMLGVLVDLSMSPLVYVGMYAIIVSLCFVIIQALQRKIHCISPAEILKHRE